VVSLPPDLDLSRFVNNLKTNTTRLIRKEFAAQVNRLYRMRMLWSRSYCAIICGGVPLSVIKQFEQQATPD
jgi:putative transposase